MQLFTYMDQSFQGYMASPESDRGPGVLVFHAWWGLTEVFTDVCDRLASAGFVALAPDLFHGATARTIDEAKTLRTQVNRPAAKKQTRTAIDYLASHPAVAGDHLGAVGFSYGSSFAMESARLRPSIINAVILFYGTGGGKLDKTRAEFQGHFAEHDEWGANPEKAAKLETRIKAADQEAEFYIYPDTTHWFFEKNHPAYDAAAAQLAMRRAIEFLQLKLS